MMEAELAGRDSIFSKPRRSLTLKFEDVVYKIKTKAHGGVQKDSTRIVLHGVSGAVRPGEMMALLGPSGCGKTSLLTILGGRLTCTGTKSANRKVTGTIAFNGCPYSSSLSRSIGFVTQDDVLYPHLTVTETLLYTALLRLPSSIPRKEKEAISEAVMTELGLQTCRNSIIGNSETRGVSGGEKKRVSIGQELLVNPSLLFLDEPTSGLDSTTAERIVSTLLNLTNGGRSVVMSIHQPSSHIFYMFHKVLLLSDGHPLYFGKGSSAMDYFASIGYEPSVLMNPCDFLLNIANGVSTDETVHDRDEIKASLVSAYNTQLKNLVQEELEEVNRQLRENEPDNNKETWCTSWWNQFTVLLERGLKERRHEAFNGFKITQVIVSSLLAGLLWFQSQGHVLDQVGLVYFIVGAWVFTPISEAIFTFPQEREMLSKERSSRMYRLSSYFMARLVGDLPMELILPTIFTTITYWMGGLKPTALSYMTFLIITLITVLVSQGLGLTIGAFIMDMRKAATFASIVTLCFMLAGGFFVQKVPEFIAWIKYTSIFFHAFKLMLLTQFTPADVFECSRGQTCSVSDLPQVKVVGFEHKELNIIIMLVMLVFYRFLAYLGLMRLGIPG